MYGNVCAFKGHVPASYDKPQHIMYGNLYIFLFVKKSYGINLNI